MNAGRQRPLILRPMTPRLTLLALGLLAWSDLGGVEVDPLPTAEVQRYHAALLRRPAPGPLFERFCDAWLASGTLAGLRAHLATRAQTSPADRLLHAWLLIRLGDDRAAVGELERVLAEGPVAGEVALQLAQARARLLDLDGAIAACVAGLPAADGALRDRLHTLHGRLLLRSGRRDEGLAVWEALAASRPDDHDLHADLIQVLIQEGLLTEAAAHLRQRAAAVADPYQRAMAGLRLGEVLDRAGQTRAAVAVWRDLLDAAAPDSWLEREVLAQVERVHRREDRSSELLALLAAVAAADPQRRGVRQRRAQLLLAAGDSDAAFAEWRELLALHPGDTRLRQDFADLLLRAGRPADAATQLAQVAATRPDDGDLLLRLAEVQHAAGDAAAVLAAVAQQRRADPSLAGGLRAAHTLIRCGAPDAARACYAELRQTYPHDADLALAQAACCFALGDAEQAHAILAPLAASGDADLLLRVVRELRQHHADAQAWDLLTARLDAFADHPLVLDAHVQLALATQRPAVAAVSARRRFYLARTAGDLAVALTQLLHAATQADQESALRAELAALPAPGVHDRCLLAALLDRLDRGDEALALLAGDDPLLVGERIRLLTARQNWDAAAHELEVLAAQPGERRLHQVQTLADLHRRRGDIVAARRALEVWQHLAPAAPQPWLLAAALHTESGENAAAVQVLRRAALRFPSDRSVLTHLAQAHSDAGERADAERLYWQLYELSDDSAQQLAWVRRLAELAEADRRTDRLLARFDERRAGDRSAIAPWLAIAEIHAVTGDQAARREALREALRLRGDHIDLLLELARLEHDTGDWHGALATLRRAETLGNSATVRLRLAEIHLQQGFTDEAERLLDPLAQDDDPQVALSALQRLLERAGADVPVALLAAAVARHPDHPQLAYLHATALATSGATAAARAAFVALLARGDWVWPAKSGPVDRSLAWRREIRAALPAGAAALLVQAWAEQALGQHQRGSPPPLPTDADAFAEACLARLGLLLANADATERAHTVAACTAAGIAHAELRLGRYGSIEDPRWPQGVDLATHPQSDEFHTVRLAMAVLGGDRQPPDAATARRLHEVWQDTWPLLACVATAVHAPELAATSLARVVAAGRPSELGLALLINGFHGPGYGRHPFPTASPALRVALAEALRAWYPEVYRARAAGTLVFDDWVLDRLLAAQGEGLEGQAAVAWLADLVTRAAALPTRLPQRQRWQSPQVRDTSPFRPLPCPPADLDQLSDLITPVLRGLDLDQMLPHLDDSLPLVIRTFLEIGTDEIDAARDRLDAALATAANDLDVLRLRIAVAGEDEDHACAAALILQATRLPMTRAQRQELDAALVHAVLELPAAEAEQSAAAQAAALRLRQASWSPQQRFALADALGRLGLDTEARRVEDASARALASGGVTVAPQDFAAQVTALVERGRPEAAVGLLLPRVQAQVAHETNPRHQRYIDMANQEPEWLTVAQDQRLVGALRTRSAALAVANQQRQREHARLLAYLGDHTAALAAHDALCSAAPLDEPLARLRAGVFLRMLPTHAVERLAVLPAEARLALLAQLEQAMTAHRGHPEALLIHAEILAEALERGLLAAPEASDFAGLALARLAGSFFIRGDRPNLPDLTSDQADHHPLAAQRRRLHDRLARGLVDHPWHGLTVRLRCADLGTTPALTADELLTVLAAHQPRPGQRMIEHPWPAQATLRHPLLRLADLAENADWPAAAATVEQLRAAGAGTLADQLASWVAVATSEGDALATALTRILTADADLGEGLLYHDRAVVWTLLDRREVALDLAVLAHRERQALLAAVPAVPEVELAQLPLTRHWLVTTTTGGLTGDQQRVRQVMTDLLGELDVHAPLQQRLAEDAASPDEQRRWGLWQALMQQCGTARVSLLAAFFSAEISRDSWHVLVDDWIDDAEPAPCLELLAALDLLAPVAQWRDLAHPRYDTDSLLRECVDRHRSPAQRQALAAALTAGGYDASFGGALVRALLDDQPEPVLTVLTAALPDIQALNPAQQQAFIDALLPVLPDVPPPAPHTQATAIAAHAWLGQARIAHGERLLARLEDPTQADFPDLDAERLAPALALRLRADPAATHALIAALGRSHEVEPVHFYTALLAAADPQTATLVFRRLADAQAEPVALHWWFWTALVPVQLDPLTPIQHLVRDLDLDDPRGLLPLLTAACRDRPLAQVRGLLTQKDPPRMPGLATWWRTAAALELRRRGEVVPESAFAPLTSASTSSLPWRLAAWEAWWHLPRGMQPQDTDLARSALDLLEACASARFPVSDWQCAVLLDTALAGVADATVAARLSRQLRRHLARAAEDHRLGNSCLRVALALDEDGIVRRLLIHDGIAMETATWCDLLRAGRSELAAQTMRRHLESLRTWVDLPAFDARSAELLATLPELVADPGERQLFAALLAAGPDSDRAARRARLRTLATTIDPALAPNTNAVLLQFLAPEAGDLLADLARAALGSTSAEAWISGTRHLNTTVRAALLGEFQRGEAAVVPRIQALLAAAASGERHPWWYADRILHAAAEHGDAWFWGGRDVDHCALVLAALRAMAPAAHRLDDCGTAIATDTVLLTLLTVGPDDLIAWRAELETQQPEALAAIDRRFSWSRLRDLLVRAVGDPQAPFAAQRLDLVAAVLHLDERHLQATITADLLDDWVAFGLVTWDELDALCRSGTGPFAAAAWQRRQERHPAANEVLP